MAFVPTPAMEDFWKILWHVDVEKDHGKSYDKEVINGFLPSNTMKAEITFDGKGKISADGEASRFVTSQDEKKTPRPLEFRDLFKYLTKVDFDEFQRKGDDGKEFDVNLNPGLFGSIQPKYQVKKFPFSGQEGAIKAWVGGDTPLVLFVDTHVGLEKLMEGYPDIVKKSEETSHSNLIYAFTREIESDAAGKTHWQSDSIQKMVNDKPSKFSQRYFYEAPPPANPTAVVFPDFTEANKEFGLSYFYCKYPVYLQYKGLDTKKNKPEVQMTYMKEIQSMKDGAPIIESKMIVVSEGANEAGAIDKIKRALLKVAGGVPKEYNEMVFISKHHGDVAQALVKFRDVALINPNGKKMLDQPYKKAYVSYDTNAIIKALTIGMDYIFMYSVDKKHVYVWKNTLGIPYADLERQSVLSHAASLKKKIETYNNIYAELNKKKMVFDIVAKRELDNAKGYVELIKCGIRIATLSRCVPNKILTNIIFDDSLIGEIRVSNNLLEIKTKLANLSTEIDLPDVKLSDKVFKYKEKKGQINWKGEVDPKNIDLNEISLEKEIVLSTSAGTASVKDVWNAIDRKYKPIGENLEDHAPLRSKFNASYGLDLILIAYSRMVNYNNEFADLFLKRLYQLTEAEKQGTLLIGLQLILGKNEQEIKPMVGIRSGGDYGDRQLQLMEQKQIELSELELSIIKDELYSLVEQAKLNRALIELYYESDEVSESSANEAISIFLQNVYGITRLVGGGKKAESPAAEARMAAAKGESYDLFDDKDSFRTFNSTVINNNYVEKFIDTCGKKLKFLEEALKTLQSTRLEDEKKKQEKITLYNLSIDYIHLNINMLKNILNNIPYDTAWDNSFEIGLKAFNNARGEILRTEGSEKLSVINLDYKRDIIDKAKQFYEVEIGKGVNEEQARVLTFESALEEMKEIIMKKYDANPQMQRVLNQLKGGARTRRHRIPKRDTFRKRKPQKRRTYKRRRT